MRGWLERVIGGREAARDARWVVVDCETTGLDPNADRLVEIGCVELVNHIPTGRKFHVYVKPDVRMSIKTLQGCTSIPANAWSGVGP